MNISILSLVLLLQVSGPMTLDEVIHTALDRNPSMRRAHDEVVRAGAGKSEAKSEKSMKWSLESYGSYLSNPMVPPINIEAGEFGRLPTGGYPVLLPDQDIEVYEGSGNERYSVKLSCSKILYSSSKIESGIRLADLNYKAARVHLEYLRHELTCKVKEAWYSLLLAQESRPLTMAALDVSRNNLANRRLEFTNGKTTKLHVLAAESQLAERQSADQRSVQLSRTARDYLLFLMGAPQGMELSARGTLNIPVIKQDFQTLKRMAFKYRKDIKELELKVRMTTARLKLIRGGGPFKPDVIFSTDYEKWSDAWPLTADNLSQHTDDRLTASLALRMNLYDGGKISAQVKSAEADMRIAQSALNELRQGMELQVRRAWAQWNQALAETSYKDARRSEALRQLHDAESSFANNLITKSKMLKAKLGYQKSQIDHSQAIYTAIKAAISLEKATGADNLIK